MVIVSKGLPLSKNVGFLVIFIIFMWIFIYLLFVFLLSGLGEAVTSIVISTIAFGTFGTISFYFGLKYINRYKIVQSLPTSKIRSLAIGLAEVKGSVLPFKNELVAPLSGKRCTYYEYEVYEWKSSGKHSRWELIKHVAAHEPFYAQDDTAKVLVDPDGAELDLPISYSYEAPALALLRRTLPPEVDQFLKSLGVETEALFFKRRFKVVEKCLPIGSEVYILGWVGDNPYKEEATAQFGYEDLMIQKRKGEPFVISLGKEREFLKRTLLKGIALLSIGLLFLGYLLYSVIQILI